MKYYRPLEIQTECISGVAFSLNAIRLSHDENAFEKDHNTEANLDLAAKLVRAGDDHAKAMRGIMVYTYMKLQVGFMIELETHRIGIETIMTSSTMHNELKNIKGEDLADAKQELLPFKVYRRATVFSYQALRNIYLSRRQHNHSDWQIFCDWIETLPFFNKLIKGEK